MTPVLHAVSSFFDTKKEEDVLTKRDNGQCSVWQDWSSTAEGGDPNSENENAGYCCFMARVLGVHYQLVAVKGYEADGKCRCK